MPRIRLKTADDVKDKLGVDVIGMVAHVNRKKKKKVRDYKPLLISDSRSGFPFIETFKIIRTKIEHTAQREKYKNFCGNELQPKTRARRQAR